MKISSAEFEVRNPYSGETVRRLPRATPGDVDTAVEAARSGARVMRGMPLHKRASILLAAAAELIADTEPLARTMVSETGKTIRECRAEVARAAGILQLSAEETRRLHGETLPFDAFPSGEHRSGYWTREPIGVVGAITPWNVPLALAAHKIGPALGAGNAVVLKPAEQTPLNALRLAEILYAAGLPEEALRVVTGFGEDAGDALVAHPGVNMISFTGSRAVGTRLPARAGFKRVALELGGNSPVIVMPGSDLAAAAAAIVRGGFGVAGQLCISVQRIIAHEEIAEALSRELAPGIERLVVGDPMDDRTDVGTLINSEACERVEQQVREAVAAGATALCGGRRLSAAAYAPTLLANMPARSEWLTEEAFAPVVILIPCGSLPEAIEIANATPYGLNAGIFTPGVNDALRAARELDAGAVMINDVPTYRSDLMPYGGRKQSGLGREGVRFAMEEMTDLKVVCFSEF